MIKLKDIIMEIYAGGIPRYLYHATFRNHIQSIKKHGLVVGGKGKVNYDWGFDEDKYGVFLSNDENLATSFVENSENKDIPEEWFDDIVVLTIDTFKLDKRIFIKDPHMTYSSSSKTDKGYLPKSFIYKGNIPINDIKNINLLESKHPLKEGHNEEWILYRQTDEYKNHKADWLKRHGAQFDNKGRILAYHGTRPAVVKLIKQNGFRIGSNFTLKPAYAKHWGITVLKVYLPIDSVTPVSSDLVSDRNIEWNEVV